MSIPVDDMPGRASRRPEASARTPRAAGLLAGMRIRKKLIFLHTTFSLVLAGILALALRPAVREVVREAETHESAMVLAMILAEGEPRSVAQVDGRIEQWRHTLGDQAVIVVGTAADLGLDEQAAARLRGAAAEGRSEADPLVTSTPAGRGIDVDVPRLVAFDSAAERFVGVSVRLEAARRGVVKLYILTTIALLSVYGLVAVALEVFVLPRQVYGPIRALLAADQAVQEGRGESGGEIIPESQIPRDEIGEIMRSRNDAVRALRRHEKDLAVALWQLETVAADLTKKNHLLEMARRNLADSGRLASLGMMSAGLAHEMNTPLAVLKGLMEKLDAPREGSGDGLSAAEAALMKRVVGRLERLSESLLDIARVRPLQARATPLRPLLDEAWTLVCLDRRPRGIDFINNVPHDLSAHADPDRLMQVFVNLLRNAVDATGESSTQPGNEKPRIEAIGECVDRESADAPALSGREGWASVRIRDNGPGIDPAVMPDIFQPFVSSRMDSHGTGLGLAVSEGIIREHSGVIIARNVSGPNGGAPCGAEFEVLVPSPGAHEEDEDHQHDEAIAAIAPAAHHGAAHA